MTDPEAPTPTNDARPVSLSQRLLGMLLVTHPIPSLMYVTAVALFRLNTRAPLSVTLPLPRLPVPAVTEPICSVPALIVEKHRQLVD